MLDGKVVLVTGAGTGIGRALALAAAEAGASVVVNDVGATLSGEREDARAADAVVEEIRAGGGRAVANTSSVSDYAGAENMVATALREFGRLDAVVNNAGILRDSFFHRMTPEDFDAVVKVHLYGSFNTSRAAAAAFRDQDGGAYVHMTSTSGLIGNLAQANYSAAKLGIVALSKSIALDMARWHVRSNCVAPFAWSRMTSNIKVDSDEQKARVAKLREIKPERIAPLVTYLASDYGQGVTGQVFSVRKNEIFLMSQSRPLRSVHRDGGWTADTVAQHAMPALERSFIPLDVSSDVFSWEPV